MNPDPSLATAPAPRLALDVMIEAAAWTGAIDGLEALARETAETCLKATGVPAASLCVLFTDDAAVKILNNQFRGQDKPTNVLSFPSFSDDDGLGDIAIAFETVEREAAAQGKALRDHARHLIAHGILHLLGYDHEVESEAQEMEDLERRVLACFGAADPYAEQAANLDDGTPQ
jgi:probable rRNA maturation factor